LVLLAIERADYCAVVYGMLPYHTFRNSFSRFYGMWRHHKLPGHIYDAIRVFPGLGIVSARTVEPYQAVAAIPAAAEDNHGTQTQGTRVRLVESWAVPTMYREQDGAAGASDALGIVENSNAAIVGCAAVDATSCRGTTRLRDVRLVRKRSDRPAESTSSRRSSLHGLLQGRCSSSGAWRTGRAGRVQLLRRDGTCIDTAGTLVAIRDANGEPVFFTLTLWDITQQS